MLKEKSRLSKPDLAAWSQSKIRKIHIFNHTGAKTEVQTKKQTKKYFNSFTSCVSLSDLPTIEAW